MRNVSDAGVKVLGEAGCGCGLRTLILGAVWQCPFRSFCGCLVALRHSHMLLPGGVLFAGFFCGRLAARCPGCHEWWGRWGSVMSSHVVWR